MYQTRIAPIDPSASADVAGKAPAQTPAATGAPSRGTLLTYRLHPSPTPLQVSRPGSLQLAVNNRRAEAVMVESLEFAVVVGTPGLPDSASLTDGEGEFRLESREETWTFSDLGNGRFRAVPSPGAGVITTQGLVFTIYVDKIGSVVGTTPLTITERAAHTGQAPDDRAMSVQVSKFPEGFMAGDLCASSTQVAFGETTTLSWEGSAADYSIRDGIKETPLGDARTWTTGPLVRTTTFTLVVRAQEGGSTVEDHFSITVLVSNSSVLAHDLTVQGETVLRGAVQAAQLKVDGDVHAGGQMYDAMGVVFPPGGIIMWAGRTDQVPQGWALCNGQNGTPDLRSRFIQGADPAVDTGAGSVGSSGPADSHTHAINNIELTGATTRAGAHAHKSTIVTNPKESGPQMTYASAVDNPSGGKWIRFPVEPVVDHQHAIQGVLTGISSQPQDRASLMRPAWYALYFIMKCF